VLGMKHQRPLAFKKKMMRRSSIRKRLERLEAARQKQANAEGREAWIEISPTDIVGEQHLVLTSIWRGRWWFQERPGPGPQLSDFGEFVSVLHLTTDEMNA
jgi:predicted GH43/DUF377 family glycosyl hydrolase